MSRACSRYTSCWTSGELLTETSPHGNDHWELDQNGPMRRRDASINDYEIEEPERRYRWEQPGKESA